MKTVIKGKSIHMRVIERTDLVELRSWWNNPHLRGMEDIFLPVTVHQLEKKYNKWLEQGEAVHLVIERMNDRKLLGKCTIYQGYAGIDLLLPEQDEEHEKAGLEALELGLSYLFLEGRGHNCVTVWIPSWNEWLIGIAKKAGMKLAGKARRTSMREGKYFDTIVYDMLKEEFLSRKNE